MDMFAPEFSRFWLPGGDREQDVRDGSDDHRAGDASSQQQALEELAERVNAARSVF